MPHPPFSVLDLETTGKHPRSARVVQVGMSHFVDGAVSATTRHLVDPRIPIPAEATAVHGVRDRDVADSPYAGAILGRVFTSTWGSLLVGYNLVDYDLEVVRAEAARATPNLRRSFVEWARSLRGVVDVFPFAAATVTAYKFAKGVRTLSALCAAFGVELGSAHDAGCDAEATGRLALRLVEVGAMPPLDEASEASRSTWAHLLR